MFSLFSKIFIRKISITKKYRLMSLIILKKSQILFQDLNTLFLLKEKGKGHTSHTHMSYKQNKVDKCLIVAASMEEEKYVYLLKKLSESSNTVFKEVIIEFVGHLKLILFSGDFTDHYNYRLARMICFVCKQMENFEYLRCLVYDLIAIKNVIMPLTFHKIVILFARKFFFKWIYQQKLPSNFFQISKFKHWNITILIS